MSVVRTTVSEARLSALEARVLAMLEAYAMRTQAAEVEAAIEARAREGARRVDSYAGDHPWQTAGMAAAVGAAVGAIVAVLLSRN